jgi:xylan 1,4-beta-xylosidase
LDGATGGLLLFYNKRAFCGVASNDKLLRRYIGGTQMLWFPADPIAGSRLHLRIVNTDNVASFFMSSSRTEWRKIWIRRGVFHSVPDLIGAIDEFMRLRPLYSSGMVRARRSAR